MFWNIFEKLFLWTSEMRKKWRENEMFRLEGEKESILRERERQEIEFSARKNMAKMGENFDSEF